MVVLTKIFRNILWTHQIKFLQISSIEKVRTGTWTSRESGIVDRKTLGVKKKLKNQEKNAKQELRFMVQGVLRGQEFRKMEPQSTLSSLYS